MRWLALAGTAFGAMCGTWLLLTAYRVIGKQPGQDPQYDASIKYWAGNFKVIGVFSIIAFILDVAEMVVDYFWPS